MLNLDTQVQGERVLVADRLFGVLDEAYRTLGRIKARLASEVRALEDPDLRPSRFDAPALKDLSVVASSLETARKGLRSAALGLQASLKVDDVKEED